MNGYDLDIYLVCEYIEELNKLKNFLNEKEKIIAISKNYGNDLYRTTLPLVYPPIILALTALNLAKSHLNIDLPENWYKFFD